jgi:hypothetical protein
VAQTWARLGLGLVHATLHAVVVTLITCLVVRAVAPAVEGELLSSVLSLGGAAAASALASGTLIGLYLSLCLGLFGIHWGHFSSLAVQGYKSFCACASMATGAPCPPGGSHACASKPRAQLVRAQAPADATARAAPYRAADRHSLTGGSQGADLNPAPSPPPRPSCAAAANAPLPSAARPHCRRSGCRKALSRSRDPMGDAERRRRFQPRLEHVRIVGAGCVRAASGSVRANVRIAA